MATNTQKAQAAQLTDMLRKDHKKVKRLFKKFQNTTKAKDKRQIVETALKELEIHAKLEESLIYPAICRKMKDQDLMDEALEEHHVVHGIIGELKRMEPGDERYDAKVTVLKELVKHHIQEEEKELLPKAEKRDIDWEQLTDRVKERKAQLMENAGLTSSNGKQTNGRVRRKK